VQQIFPAPPPGHEVGADAGPALGRLYAYPEPGERPWLRANMVASADGAAAADGKSGSLSGAADRRVFSVLRSLADVILVGAGTARAERYRPVRPAEVWPQLRAGRAPTPPIAVLTRALDLDPGSGLLAAASGLARTIVLTTEAAAPDLVTAVSLRAEVIVAGQQVITAAAAIAALAGRGYRRILVEGGPGLLAQIIAGGMLDELCLTYSPVLAGGSAGRIVAEPRDHGTGPQASLPGRPGAGPGALTGLRLAHVLEDEGYLLCRYLRRDDNA
jgi:riboflavin biosynthesis pyrimidine reductase